MKTTQEYVTGLSIEETENLLVQVLQTLESVANGNVRMNKAMAHCILNQRGWVGNGYVATVRLGTLSPSDKFTLPNMSGAPGPGWMVVNTFGLTTPRVGTTVNVVGLGDGGLYAFSADTLVVRV